MALLDPGSPAQKNQWLIVVVNFCESPASPPMNVLVLPTNDAYSSVTTGFIAAQYFRKQSSFILSHLKYAASIGAARWAASFTIDWYLSLNARCIMFSFAAVRRFTTDTPAMA